MKQRKKIILWFGGIAIFGIVLFVVSCNLIVAWDSNPPQPHKEHFERILSSC